MRQPNKTTYTTRSVVLPDGWLLDTGLTQKALADTLGVNPPSISHWRKVGRVPAVHAAKIQAIIETRQAARLTCPFCHARQAVEQKRSLLFVCGSCETSITFGSDFSPEECAGTILICYGDHAPLRSHLFEWPQIQK